MPLTEEEKQALKKKYREQRQAIWTGKPSSRLPSQDASKVEEIEVSSDEDAPDVSAETALPRRGDPSSSSAQTDVERNESQKVKTDSPQVRDRVQVQSEDKWQEQRGETSQNEESLWNSSDEKKRINHANMETCARRCWDNHRPGWNRCFARILVCKLKKMIGENTHL